MNEIPTFGMQAAKPLERLIQPQLLLLLGLKPAHGYELIQRLNEADFTIGEVDAATVYRNLRRMDNGGLVTSHLIILPLIKLISKKRRLLKCLCLPELTPPQIQSTKIVLINPNWPEPLGIWAL